MKTLENSFKDWESDVFGFGYGTGEEYIIPALKHFMELCSEGSYGTSYDHDKLTACLTGAVAWLLINALCKADIIEYGTSPRYAWLTDKGKCLKEFVASRTVDELYEIAAGGDENYTSCSPKYCNCGENGYEEGRVCANPFW